MTLLPNKKLLIWNWDRDGASGYDFKTWVVSDLSAEYDYKKITEVAFNYSPLMDHEIFCAGHAQSHDGKLFVAGGHGGNEDIGNYFCKMFDHSSGTNGAWGTLSNMNPLPNSWSAEYTGDAFVGNRWYPTCLILPNRRILILAGTRAPAAGGNPPISHKLPEIWSPAFGELATDAIGQFPRMNNDNNYWDVRAYYPHAFVDPRDGNVLIMGGSAESDPASASGTNKRLDLVTLGWTTVFPHTNGSGSSDDVPSAKENYASAVMVDGMIIRSGGSANGASGFLYTGTSSIPSGNATPAVKNAMFLKLLNSDGSSVTSPVWEKAPNSGASAGQMNLARKNHTLVALPTGEVVAMGGNLARNNPNGLNETDSENTSASGNSGSYAINGAADRTTPEMWNSLNPSAAWALLAQPDEGHRIGRPYHSTAILLPDARVILAGGEKEATDNGSNGDLKRKFQIFSPPYGGSNSWEANRPTWNSHPPSEAWYGGTGTLYVDVASGRQVAKLALVSLGSTTHAFVQNQRVVFLAKDQLPTTGSNSTKSISVTMPASPKIAPPGYYMLFAVDNEGNGVPSLARFIRLRDHEPLGVESASITTGSNGGGSTSGTRLQTACNDYFADSVGSTLVGGTTHTVELLTTHYGNIYDQVKEIRAHVECKTSSSATLEILVKNWGTGNFDSWGTASTSSTETLTEKLQTFGSQTGAYFDSYDPFKMHVKLRWTSTSSSFTVYLDALEMAVKP